MKKGITLIATLLAGSSVGATIVWKIKKRKK